MEYSFLLPVYNCRAYLAGCVASIQAAQMPSYEILLIDDGSTDGSGSLCDALAAKAPEIRVIHQTNAGPSAARNRGIQESRGEKLLFIDADDSIDPDALRAILSDPRCSQADLTIFGLTFDYYKNGVCYRRDPLYYDFDGVLDRAAWGSAFDELYSHNSLSSLCNKVFKRDMLIKHDLALNTNMFLYEDFEFVLRYLRHCGPIWNVPQSVYHYRQTEDEGNAKRRLARIGNLNAFLVPIENALTRLSIANPAISPVRRDSILQMLYLVLAREKISVSTRSEVSAICEAFIQWAESRTLPLEATAFQKKLLNRKVFSLLFCDKKTAVRHKVAVWVKSHRR